MLWNYISIALRNAGRHRGYAFINLVGLATGLAACLLITLYVRFELGFDRMHEKADRIVRVEMDVQNSAGERRWKSTMLPVGPLLTERIPQIEATARVSGGSQNAVRVGDLESYEDRFYQTEPTFFDLFDFRIVSGRASELDAPHTVMISESTARKYFGPENPVGRTMEVAERYASDTMDFTVVGVFEDMPPDVHFRADFLASIATSVASAREGGWSNLAFTYALLAPGATEEGLSADFAAFDADVLRPNFSEGASLATIPLTRIHLHSGHGRGLADQGDIRYVWIFSAIAGLILLIACINYMNLATARSAQRAREVGVRKVVGARQGQLVGQFMSESVVFAFAASFLSVGLVQIVLPVFNAVMDVPLALEFGDVTLLAALTGAALFVGLISGSYPALILSRMRPTGALKGGPGHSSGSGLRKGLVVFQFTVSMALIVGAVVIDRQLDFVSEKKLGFEKEQTLTLSTRGRLDGQVGAFRDRIAATPGVSAVAMSSSVPSTGGWISGYAAEDIEQYEGEDGVTFDLVWVDDAFIGTLGLELAAGRAFDPARPGDRETGVMINETAARLLGWDDPIGMGFMDDGTRREVIGVVRDFHTESLKEEVGPMILRLGEDQLVYAAVRLETTDVSGTIAGLRSIWQEFIPALPFQYSFLDDEFDAMYRSEQRLGRLFNAFALLAVLVAALGLLGLAAFTAQQRTKEIGIRKVLGASISGIVVMLSGDFVRLVLVAFVIAVPLAWFAMEDWLSAFAYRIEIGPGIFAVAGLIALTIAIATVSWQAVRAALANPVDSLRSE